MKIHIVFKEKEDDFYSRGDTFSSSSLEEALEQWREKYPQTIFMCMYPMPDVKTD